MEIVLTWLRRHVRVLVVGCAALAALVLGTVWWIGFRATDQVTATTGVPQCRGTQLTTVTDIDGLRRPAIPMRDGFRCSLTISVTNQSHRTVTVERLVFPFGGPEARAGYRVVLVTGGFSAVHDRTDTAAELRWPLDPGETELVHVPLTFRGRGCMSQGSWMSVQPTIEVTGLLAAHDLKVADLPVFLGTADSSCDG